MASEWFIPGSEGTTGCLVVWLWDLAYSSSGTETSPGVRQSLSQNHSSCELVSKERYRLCNGYFSLKNVSSTRSCVGWDMCYVYRTIVCRRECCFPCPTQRGGQPLTWQWSMKEITKRLGAVGATRLPGWGPRDPHCVWLETLQDMAANRCQWRSCFYPDCLSLADMIISQLLCTSSASLIVRCMKDVTKLLGAVGETRLPGWRPHDPHWAWLETLQDMAANRYQ
ncbi:hypothetical protein T265_05141 [Opisthorchis viverrini]|uniref:Uncharacterized protein n=1 Tax=Opisthorchis viverrini TaxID=6198 RepID=A0A074ZLH6_OPIVI|nr:hypothetical protein T265_05141 [Opisthorchis viverrini]KER27941.1 hypothetical protein T265_05141 [Opisthorchis viverrini]